jgi:hypothetical protein
VELRLVSLDDTTAVVDVEGQQYRLSIGQNLAEAARGE